MFWPRGIYITILLALLSAVEVSASGAVRRRVDITVSNQDVVCDKTRVVINEVKSEDYEYDCDAAKFLSSDVPAQIYTIGPDGTQYAINERPAGDGIIPLGLWTGKAGIYTFGTIYLGCDLLLVDKLLGVSHYLSEGPYEFSTQRGTFDNRFELHVPVWGDVDGNGDVDAADVALLVSYLLGQAPAGFDQHCADVNGDGRISVADVVGLAEKCVECGECNE